VSWEDALTLPKYRDEAGKMKFGAWLLVALLLVTGCSQSSIAANKHGPSSAKPETAESDNPPPGAVLVAGGCGSTQVYTGPIPRWAEDVATGDGIPGYSAPKGPYAIATPPTAVAFLSLAYPLLSGYPTKTMRRANKVLWAIQGLREGVLAVDAYPLGSSSAAMHYEFGPGTVSRQGAWFGSGLDVPTPGCWRFVLRWAGHSAEMDLQYE